MECIDAQHSFKPRRFAARLDSTSGEAHSTAELAGFSRHFHMVA